MCCAFDVIQISRKVGETKIKGYACKMHLRAVHSNDICHLYQRICDAL